MDLKLRGAMWLRAGRRVWNGIRGSGILRCRRRCLEPIAAGLRMDTTPSCIRVRLRKDLRRLRLETEAG
jgi:hypothetical protein